MFKPIFKCVYSVFGFRVFLFFMIWFVEFAIILKEKKKYCCAVIEVF